MTGEDIFFIEIFDVAKRDRANNNRDGREIHHAG